jgi:ABC-type sugar transport system permease subunit
MRAHALTLAQLPPLSPRRVLGRDWKLGFLFVAPMALLVLGLVAFPFLYALSLSMTRKFIGYPAEWVWFENYVELWYDPSFRRTAINSVTYTFLAEVFKFLLGLAMALTLNARIRAKAVFTGLLLLPYVIPTVVSVLAWYWIYDGLFGVLNYVLLHAHVVGKPVAWLGESRTALGSVIAVNVWRGFPFFGMLFLAGLRNIPGEIYEAASIDGAGLLQQFRHVSLPGIKAVILVTLLLSTLLTLNDFQIVFLLTKGGPGGATQVFATLTYEIGIQGQRLGQGIAVSLYLVPALALMIVTLARYLRRDGASA